MESLLVAARSPRKQSTKAERFCFATRTLTSRLAEGTRKCCRCATAGKLRRQKLQRVDHSITHAITDEGGILRCAISTNTKRSTQCFRVQAFLARLRNALATGSFMDRKFWEIGSKLRARERPAKNYKNSRLSS